MGGRAPVGDTRHFAQALFGALPDRYDRLAEWLSFWQNRRWRRAMVTKVLGDAPAAVPGDEAAAASGVAPALVCDVATGTAGVAIQLASRSPVRVVGVDLTGSMLQRAKENVERAGVAQRVVLAQGAAEQLPFPDSAFEALCFTYLLRYVDDPGATLAELARVVRPGGVVASLEFLVPENPLWRSAWWLYTRVVLPLAGWLTGGREWFEVGRFLGPSISDHHLRFPLSRTIQAWHEAGLTEVEARKMSLGGGLVMWGRRAGAGELTSV
jgi:demethylmenaquinone methyltransferase/2-methoxy-6-polyprenyl-1,4-benzoquinol methylase